MFLVDMRVNVACACKAALSLGAGTSHTEGQCRVVSYQVGPCNAQFHKLTRLPIDCFKFTSVVYPGYTTLELGPWFLIQIFQKQPPPPLLPRKREETQTCLPALSIWTQVLGLPGRVLQFTETSYIIMYGCGVVLQL